MASLILKKDSKLALKRSKKNNYFAKVQSRVKREKSNDEEKTYFTEAGQALYSHKLLGTLFAIPWVLGKQ